MTNSELVNNFFNFEKKNNLFELKTDDGFYWWDVVRYHVYIEIVSKLGVENKNNNNNNKNKNKNFFKLTSFLISDFLYLLKSKFKKINYFFLLYPRNIDNNGFAIDNISNEALKLLKNNSFIIDNLKTGKMTDTPYSNIFLSLFRKIHTRKNKEHNLNIDGIDMLLKAEFNVEFRFKDKIDNLLSIFEADIKYYNILLKLFRPKIIFFVATGSEKGLLYVCNNLGIKSAEFQHGQANKMHMYYSYPNSINYEHLKTLPYAFLSLSSYWHKTNYPVKVKLDVGNSAYSVIANKSGNNIVVMCHDIYMSELLPLIHGLALKIKDRKIIVKLHPEQANEARKFKDDFKDFNNIDIVCNEKNSLNVLNNSSSMITIQSTTVYESIQLSVKVFLYKKKDYSSHCDLFNNKNVYLVDNIDQIIENMDNEFISSGKLTFFKKFDKGMFLKFIREFG